MTGVYEIGRVCVKTSGREAGSYCVVMDVIDKNYALVEGPKIRRRRVNFKHLEPIESKVDIKKGVSETDLAAAIKKAGLESKMQSTVKISPL
ncbi:MAG: LSU ribosomal protein L14e [Promethearchaeota archaeon CR_4]|nr:MAG: LSU ribosomal protein L14e [Candidatus Lokiarchaeota archaeon CR_4]